MDAKVLEAALLKAPQEVLALIVNLVDQLQPKPATLPPSDGTGPDVYTPGQPHALTTKPLGDNEIDALYKGKAEAVVVEKLVTYVMGVIAGIGLVA